MMLKVCAVSFIFLPVISHAQSTADSAAHRWTGNASAYYYFIPGENLAPTVTGYFDNDSLHLHLEGRFDYEDFNTFSVFAGYKWTNDTGAVQLTVIPMAGIALGRTKGFLPGLEFNMVYKEYTLYSENEYMLDFKGHENDFFYSWTQLNRDVFKNVKAGLVAQTLRWYKTKFNVQRGVYAEYGKGSLTLDFYYFNLLTTAHFMIASASVNF